MYAGGWTGGFLRHGGEGGFYTEVTHDEADFFGSQCLGEGGVGVVCLGLLKATLSLCILHTLFLLLYILLFLFFHFKKNANIYCTLSVLLKFSFFSAS